MTDAVAALADFPQRLRMASWFSFVGTPLSDAERADISEYTESLGLGPLPVTELGDWRAASRKRRPRADAPVLELRLP